jgi:hypothetical protein
MVMVPRRTIDAVDLLNGKLLDGGKNAGVAELVAKSIQNSLKILVSSEISEVYEGNEDFAAFLTDFIFGKPFWL